MINTEIGVLSENPAELGIQSLIERALKHYTKIPIQKVLNFEAEKFEKKIENIRINTSGPWDKALNEL